MVLTMTVDETQAEVEEIPDDDPDYDFEGETPLQVEDLQSLVLYTLDWSVQSLLERIGTSFDVAPTFQRRDAWTPERKSRYVESLILGLPVPQIVLAEDPSKKGRFIVLDGKQRLLTIKQFAAPDTDFPQFKLKKLEFATDLEGMTFQDIEASIWAEHAQNFLSQPVRTIVVRDWKKPAVLYQVFVRLNQGSLPLSPQELRQGLYPSQFTRWVNARSAVSVPIQLARRIKREDFRMRDAEMLLRYVAFADAIETYTGNLREFLDQACIDGGADWPAKGEAYFDELAARCELAITRTFDAFTLKDSFLRWEEGKYIRRFNIAVFDVMTLVLGDPSISNAEFVAKAPEIVTAFQDLCDGDARFRDSLVVTTKTKDNTGYRVSRFAEAVEALVGHDLQITTRARSLT